MGDGGWGVFYVYVVRQWHKDVPVVLPHILQGIVAHGGVEIRAEVDVGVKVQLLLPDGDKQRLHYVFRRIEIIGDAKRMKT